MTSFLCYAMLVHICHTFSELLIRKVLLVKKGNYLILTLTLLLLLVACGKDTTEHTDNHDSMLDSEQETEQKETPETPEIADENAIETEKENVVLNSIYLYFSDHDLMNVYRVETKDSFTKNEEGILKALQLWADGPKQEGLHSLLPEGVLVQTVENKNGIAYISFSNELSTANLGSTGEGMLVEQIAMIVKQFGYDEVFILINGEVIDSLLGHLDWSEPFKVEKSADDYEVYTRS